MKTPSSIKIKSKINDTEITVKTFDSSLLLFQITLCLIPILLIEFLVIKPDTFLSISIFLAIITAITLWILSNLQGKYIISINSSEVTFTTKSLGSKNTTFNLDSIQNFKIKRRTGKTITGGRSGVTTTGPNVDDYYIITDDQEYLMTPGLSTKEKEFIKYKIEEFRTKKVSHS